MSLPYDLRPIAGTGLSELHLPFFNYEYTPRAISKGILPDNDLSLEERLARTRMIESVDQPWATVLGLFVLGIDRNPFLPQAYIHFLRIDGIRRSDFVISESDIRGSIYEQIKELDINLRAHNRKIVEFIGRPKEIQTFLYPPSVLRLIARNAILHRDYENFNSPVLVHWFNNRIEIISPGGPARDMTSENFGYSGLAEYRNPNLAEAMKLLGLIGGSGKGIGIAKEVLADAGNPPMELQVDRHRVKVILRPHEYALQKTYSGRIPFDLDPVWYPNS